jgi:hypothetical protein
VQCIPSQVLQSRLNKHFGGNFELCSPRFWTRCNPGADEEETCPPPALRLVDCRDIDGVCRVEILYDGVWGTICDDSFDDADATVVCRQLGYNASVARAVQSFGGGEGRPIWMDDLSCKGNENALSRCRFEEWGQHNCNHDEDVGVYCKRDVYSDSTLTSGGDGPATRQNHANRISHSRGRKPRNAPHAHAPAENRAAGGSKHDKEGHLESALSGGDGPATRQKHANRVSHSRGPKPWNAPHAQAHAVNLAAGDSKYKNKDKHSESALSGGGGRGTRHQPANRARHSRRSKAQRRSHWDDDVCFPRNTDQCCIWSQAFPGTATPI